MRKFSDLFKKSNSSKNTVADDSLSELLSTRPQAPLPNLRPGQNLFRHVPLGSGGTFNLDPSRRRSLNAIPYIGTTACLNSVGVFFEISDTKCFCAHIDAFMTCKRKITILERESTNADVDKGEGATSNSFRKVYATDFMTAKTLRVEVITRLNTAGKSGTWGPKSDRMRSTLVMTCAKMYGQEPQAAEVVAKAVREWLVTGASEKGKRVAKSGAVMIAGWPGAGVEVFDSTPSSEWSAINAGLGDGKWSYGVEDTGLEAREEDW